MSIDTPTAACRVPCWPQTRFQVSRNVARSAASIALIIGGPEEPQRNPFAGRSRQIDKIVEPAIGFLATLEAILGRDISVSRVEPGRKIGAFAHVQDLAADGEEVYAARPNLVWYFELAKGTGAILIERDGKRIQVSVLRHELPDGPVCVALGVYLAQVDEIILPNFHLEDIGSRDAEMPTEKCGGPGA